MATQPEGMPDQEIASQAARDCSWVSPLSDCCFGDEIRQGLILNFGGASAVEMPFAVSRLRHIMDGAKGRRSTGGKQQEPATDVQSAP